VLNIGTLSENVLIAFAALLVLLVLLVPISLRLAGLTGQQIADVLAMTWQFFTNIVREFRAQNKST